MAADMDACTKYCGKDTNHHSGVCQACRAAGNVVKRKHVLSSNAKKRGVK